MIFENCDFIFFVFKSGKNQIVCNNHIIYVHYLLFLPALAPPLGGWGVISLHFPPTLHSKD